jgi:hypothetical protein
MTSKARKLIERVLRELRAVQRFEGVSGVATEAWADQLQLALEFEDMVGEAAKMPAP